jgi:23S rRNA (pseudouridine1915-N3)-methyltransferase
MRIRLICFGRLAPRSLKPAVDDYTERLRRVCRLELEEIPEQQGPSALEKEAALVRKRWEGLAVRISMDSRGETWTSERWASELESWRRDSPHVAMALGSADGLHSGILEESRRVSLGPATLPHSLARLVLLEQIYRAHTQVLGHPYHLGH